MSNNLADSIRNIPPVTRFFTISTVMVCFAHSLRLIDLHDLFCTVPSFLDCYYQVKHTLALEPGIFKTATSYLWLIFQCHRFITCFLVPWGLVAGQPIQAIMDIYFFYTFANHLESTGGKFGRNFPDCLWFTLLTGTIILLLTFMYDFFIDSLHIPIHHQMMLSCVTYIWSRSLKNSIINFMGIVPIQAYYLPLFNLFIKLVVNSYSSFIDLLIGIAGGYLYQCIQSDTLPIYNLIPGTYAAASRSHGITSVSNGRKVGFSSFQYNNNEHVQALGSIQDSIFDLGYLKAPVWLYKILNYPQGTSKGSTAHVKTPFAGKGRSIASSSSSKSTSSSTAASSRIRTVDDESEGASTGYTSWFANEDKFKGTGHKLTD